MSRCPVTSLFELKHDGFRALAFVHRDGTLRENLYHSFSSFGSTAEYNPAK